MNEKSKPPRPDAPPSSRQERLATALRENLARRKAQARRRAAAPAPKPPAGP